MNIRIWLKNQWLFVYTWAKYAMLQLNMDNIRPSFNLIIRLATVRQIVMQVYHYSWNMTLYQPYWAVIMSIVYKQPSIFTLFCVPKYPQINEYLWTIQNDSCQTHIISISNNFILNTLKIHVIWIFNLTYEPLWRSCVGWGYGRGICTNSYQRVVRNAIYIF